MDKVITYIRESFSEVKNNVTWPSFKELQASTTLVLVASLIFAAVVGVFDYIFQSALEFIY